MHKRRRSDITLNIHLHPAPALVLAPKPWARSRLLGEMLPRAATADPTAHLMRVPFIDKAPGFEFLRAVTSGRLS
jgi:hypothetical protein